MISINFPTIYSTDQALYKVERMIVEGGKNVNAMRYAK